MLYASICPYKLLPLSLSPSLPLFLSLSLSLFPGVTIGFERTVYNMSEDQPTVDVCAFVLSGMIGPGRTVPVELQTQPGTAAG